MVNALKTALQRRSGDISLGDALLIHILGSIHHKREAERTSKRASQCIFKIVDERLENLHFAGDHFSGPVFQSLLW